MPYCALAALLLMVAACTPPLPGPDATSGPGRLEVQWAGDASGQATFRLTGTLCADQGLVEVLGYKGEVGAGFTLWIRDSVVVGRYPVGDPEVQTPTPPRPSAGVALRWFDQNRIAGFEGDSGWVEIQSRRRNGGGESGSGEGDVVSGALEVHLRAVDRPDTLVLQGRFHDLPLVADTLCPVRHV